MNNPFRKASTVSASATTAAPPDRFQEIGTSGLTRFGGMVYEDFIPLLQWPRAGKVYKEMSYNDPVVGSILFAAEMLIRNTTWRVEPRSPAPVDIEAAQFLTECLDDLDKPWVETITEILSILTYGWSLHELVYKYRGGDVRDPKRKSQYADNRIGWRKIAGRSQNTLVQWVFDDVNDELQAMVQRSASSAKQCIIPMDKALLFRTKVESGNPEGKSVLRNAYRPWYFKKHIEEIEGIGIERDLAGLPVLTTPEGVDLWGGSDERTVQIRVAAENIVKNVRRDQNEGLILPFGWEFKLASTGGSRQFDTSAIINRYDQRIAITLLADIVMLGADKVGSFALANVKKGMLATALDSVLDIVTEVFNRQAIPQLFKLNVFPGLVLPPKLVHGSVETPDLTELSNFIQKMAGAKMPLFPDEELENYLRTVSSLPKLNDKSPREASKVDSNTGNTAGDNKNTTGSTEKT